MKRPETCPICSAPSDPRLRPFCSQRCADVDLGRWLKEGYVIPVQPDEEFDQEDGPETARARRRPEVS